MGQGAIGLELAPLVFYNHYWRDDRSSWEALSTKAINGYVDGLREQGVVATEVQVQTGMLLGVILIYGLASFAWGLNLIVTKQDEDWVAQPNAEQAVLRVSRWLNSFDRVLALVDELPAI